jgi:hypothetical protein
MPKRLPIIGAPRIARHLKVIEPRFYLVNAVNHCLNKIAAG